VLLWFGWGIYISAKNRTVSLNFTATEISSETTTRPELINPLISGIILSLTNPYWSLWWATVGVSYVVIAMNLGAAGLLTFFTGHILSDLVWFSFVSFIMYTGRNFISDSLYRGVLVVCAAFLVLLGCWFAYDGFQQLFLLFHGK
jgi:threonine/homoserine/homoserine lactone efflux protein